jgi:formylglycine-generating enzyme required for sulfatase activity
MKARDLAGTERAICGCDEALGVWMALVATGMGSFEAIAPAAQGDRLTAACLWMRALRLVDIPAGAFRMGSLAGGPYMHDEEGPAHQVRIAYPYRMSEVPGTQGAWEALMGDNPSHFRGDPSLPVECVSWDNLCGQDGFLERLNALTEGARPEGQVFRLPSEAEWEHACRAGSATTWSFGDDLERLGAHGWFEGNANGRTHPVGLKIPNPWGLFDMNGNVWEWCQDIWHETYRGAPRNGGAWIVGDPEWRVLRGGGWDIGAFGVKSASRAGAEADCGELDTGFRIVLGPSQMGVL